MLNCSLSCAGSRTKNDRRRNCTSLRKCPSLMQKPSVLVRPLQHWLFILRGEIACQFGQSFNFIGSVFHSLEIDVEVWAWMLRSLRKYPKLDVSSSRDEETDCCCVGLIYTG